MIDTTPVKPIGVAAVLMADIDGYSRLMSLNEEKTSRRVAEAIELMQQLIKDYGGEIKNIAGDGVLALFDNVTDSIDFAVAMQEEFIKDTVWASQDEPIAFRIGITVGEVREGNFGLHGHAINVASRI
ncbi:MAG: adenylate/guanylate cyclase domain-containing protein, partial [Pseudomonadota bacterium]